MSLNLADLFEAIADAVPDRTALICGDGRLTYRELDAGANRLAHHLTSAGIVAGDHIGLYMRNSTEFVEALLAILKIRAVPININYRYVDAELAYLFANAELAAVVADGGSSRPGPLRCCRVRRRSGTSSPWGPAADVDWDTVTTADFHKAVAAQSGERDFAPRSGDDRFIIYTGGTTGMPKGVMWRAEDFFHAALSGGNPMGDPHSDIASVAAQAANMPAMTWMLTAPLIHGAAMYSMFSAFCLGTSQVVVPSFEAKKVLALIERERVMTMTIVGDAMARPLADAIAEHGAEYDLSSLFVVGSGGALFSKNVREQLVSLLPNVMVRDGFGSSESGIDGDLSIGEDGRMRIAAKPTVKVVDERMRPIEPGSGEIGYIARAGHVPLGYWGDPEKTAATFPPVIDGVRMSILGDMASVDEDGTIVLLGRGSMCINTGGGEGVPGRGGDGDQEPPVRDGRARRGSGGRTVRTARRSRGAGTRGTPGARARRVDRARRRTDRPVQGSTRGRRGSTRSCARPRARPTTVGPRQLSKHRNSRPPGAVACGFRGRTRTVHRGGTSESAAKRAARSKLSVPSSSGFCRQCRSVETYTARPSARGTAAGGRRGPHRVRAGCQESLHLLVEQLRAVAARFRRGQIPFQLAGDRAHVAGMPSGFAREVGEDARDPFRSGDVPREQLVDQRRQGLHVGRVQGADQVVLAGGEVVENRCAGDTGEVGDVSMVEPVTPRSANSRLAASNMRRRVCSLLCSRRPGTPRSRAALPGAVCSLIGSASFGVGRLVRRMAGVRREVVVSVEVRADLREICGTGSKNLDWRLSLSQGRATGMNGWCGGARVPAPRCCSWEIVAGRTVPHGSPRHGNRR